MARALSPIPTAVRPLVRKLKRARPEVYAHGLRVAAVMRAAAAHLGVPAPLRCRWVLGGLLHDVGKIVLPPSLLAKRPPLQASEWHRIRQHVHYGLFLAERLLGPHKAKPLAPLLFLHHERPDGKGYPLGLTREQIPHEVRLLSIADAYVAMREPRPYRHPRTHEEALRELLRHRDTQFEAKALEAMLPVLRALAQADFLASNRPPRLQQETLIG